VKLQDDFTGQVDTGLAAKAKAFEDVGVRRQREFEDEEASGRHLLPPAVHRS
jgi:hypothetical protein